MTRFRLIIAACLLGVLIGVLGLLNDRLVPNKASTTAQTLHSAWLAQHGNHAPTKWGMHLLLDDGEIQWPTDVWDDHLAYTRRLVGESGYVLQLTRLGDLDAGK